MAFRIQNAGPGNATVTGIEVRSEHATTSDVFGEVSLPRELKSGREWDLPYVPCDLYHGVPLLIVWKSESGEVDQYESVIQ